MGTLVAMVLRGDLDPTALSERLVLARESVAANTLRLQEARDRLIANRDRWQVSRTLREASHESAYIRLLARFESQPVIEQAKGILMAESGCGPDEAFDILRRASQRQNTPVRELARQIVDRAASRRQNVSIRQNVSSRQGV